MKTRLAIALWLIASSVAALAEEPLPKTCPFGHTNLSRRKVESLCVPGPVDELFCRTCGFGYDEMLRRWERAVGPAELTPEALPGFPAVIRNIPVPNGENEMKSVRYRQVRKESVVVQESCLYWTGEKVERTKDRLRKYLVSAGYSPVERSRPYGPRIYSYFFARSGDRFLRVEVMLESNAQVAVDARLEASSEIEHDYILREALGIDPPNQAPLRTPGSGPPAAGAPVAPPSGAAGR